MTAAPRPVIVMGVSGSGKTTIGEALADRWDAEFVDADSLHPDANKDKMHRGVPLTDDDRWPWLDICAERIRDVEATGRRCVMANSALKRVYRDRLRGIDPDLFFVLLSGSHDLIAERQRHRHHEYMPNSLLDSQFEALEPLEPDEQGLTIHTGSAVDDIVAQVDAALGVDPPRD